MTTKHSELRPQAEDGGFITYQVCICARWRIGCGIVVLQNLHDDRGRRPGGSWTASVGIYSIEQWSKGERPDWECRWIEYHRLQISASTEGNPSSLQKSNHNWSCVPNLWGHVRSNLERTAKKVHLVRLQSGNYRVITSPRRFLV